MFKDDQKVIAEFSAKNADNFARVQKFVICTIQQQLKTAVKQSNGERDLNAFGFKLKALANIAEYKEYRYQAAYELYTEGEHDELLSCVSSWFGFGLVKAGFVLQLAFGISGCIDTHNLKLFGIKKNTVTLGANVKSNTRLKKAIAYNQLIQKIGGTEFLWDTWCEYVAVNQPRTYTNAAQVSSLHVDAIVY